MTDEIAKRLVVATLAERPDLRGKVFDRRSSRPCRNSSGTTRSRCCITATALDRYLDYALVAVDPAEPDRPVARAFCVPFAFRDGTPGRDALPDGGWDAVIRWAHDDHSAAECGQRAGDHGDAAAAGAGHLTGDADGDARQRAAGSAFELWAPLRPTEKDREPETPFAEYTARRRADGLPFDAWVRTHVRAGAEIVKPRRAACHPRHARRMAEMDRAAASTKAARRSCQARSTRFTSRSNRTTRFM